MTANRPRAARLATLGVVLVAGMIHSGCVAVLERGPAAAEAPPPRPLAAAEPGWPSVVENRFERARRDPNRLRAFFLEMPKAGELHHHLTGAVYAETLIQIASYRGDCLGPTGRIGTCGGVAVEPIPVTRRTPDCRACEAGRQCPVDANGDRPVCCLCADSGDYDALVNALSMRGLPWGTLSAHDHFFAIFGKLGTSVADEGAIIAQLRQQAARENILYIETMLAGRGGDEAIQALREAYPKDDQGRDLCGQLAGADPAAASILPYEEWPGQPGFDRAMAELAASLVEETLDRSDALLGCGDGAAADVGCGVTVRLLIELHRTRQLEDVCVEGIRAFTAANARPGAIVGMNIVAPEDAYRSRVDYIAHMNLIGNLGRLFPEVGIALHAGELREGLVPPDDLRFHMTAAVARAGAKRLGHGVSVTYETDSAGLLDRMAGRAGPPVGMEINLVSNAQLLGIEGDEHPLPLYVESGVPVVLSTDDPGIMRTSLTEQFRWAAEQYPELGYADFRRFNRNVLEHGFLPGASIWRDGGTYEMPVAGCRQPDGDRLDLERCAEWAAGRGDRAALQVELERRLRAFEGR